MLCFLLVIGVGGAASRKVRSERGIRDTLEAAVCVWVLVFKHSDFGPIFWLTKNTLMILGGKYTKAPALPLPAAHRRQGCWQGQGPETPVSPDAHALVAQRLLTFLETNDLSESKWTESVNI